MWSYIKNIFKKPEPIPQPKPVVIEPKPVEVKKPEGLPWMKIAKNLLGTDEVPGPGSNPVIVKWAKDMGGFTAKYYTSDDIPWCGLFVGHCIYEAKIPVTIENPLYARDWNDFGTKCSPCFGAIMVFSRDGGGHVGFYVSEDSDAYHILGGNQSDSVNVTRVAKGRLLGARWPTQYLSLMKPEKIVKKFDGKLSTNEA